MQRGTHSLGPRWRDPPPTSPEASLGAVRQLTGSTRRLKSGCAGFMIPKAGALPKQERGGTRCTQEALCELPWGAGRDWEAPRTLWPRGESTWEGQRAEVKGDRDGSEGATSLTGPLRPQAGEGPAGAARCPVSPWVGPWSTKAHSLFHLSRESRSWPRRSAAAELFQGLPAPRVDFI